MSRFALRTLEPTNFGSGWISGVFSATLGLIGLGAVLCFRFPELLTTPEARALYPLPWVRALLHLVLVGAFVLGVASLWLRRNKALGTVGITCTLAAALLGGSGVPVEGEVSPGPFLGLDWFLLNLIVYSLVFVPIERLFARLPEQGVFRASWRTDLTYFFVSALLVQVTTILTLEAGDGAVRLGGGAGGAALDAQPAGRAAVPAADPGRRLHAVLGASRVPRACRCCGAFTRCTIRRSRWTGSPARACTWSTSP